MTPMFIKTVCKLFNTPLDAKTALTRTAPAIKILPLLLAAAFAGPAAISSVAQTPAAPAAASASRFLGTLTAVSAGTITVKTDAGAERKVTVPDGIKLQRIAPGEKDLSKAATIQFSDLAVGDRVLVRIAPDPATDPVTAISIVAIPQADLAQKQQKDREEWQHNGVGGLVKSVDAGTGIIVITSGAGATQKTITLHTTPATVLRRYASDSVSFDAAKPAPLEVVKPGDQLRARGTKNGDGTEIAAEEVVSGSFRNIAGTISSINAATMTVTLKDLATKQTVNVHVGPDVQMRKLPEAMAKNLASSSKAPGASADANSSANASAQALPTSNPAAPGSGQPRTYNGAPGNGAPGNGARGGRPGADQAGASSDNSEPAAGGRHGGGGDPQQMLARAPAIHLSDLQKGDAIMLVSTQGTTDVTAITLLAGVEPLLQAPASTQNMLLSSWSMSSGGAEAAAQ